MPNEYGVVIAAPEVQIGRAADPRYRNVISGNNAGTRCGGERASLRLQGYLFVREAAPQQP